MFARTDTKWFHDYCTQADALLFLKGRIQFVDGLQKTGIANHVDMWKECLRVLKPGGDRKSTRLNSSHSAKSRMPSSA